MDDPVKQNFGTEDFIAFGALLLVSCIVGIYFAYKDRKKTSVDSYFFAEKHVHPVALGLSLAVTFQSSVGIISGPAEVYIVGTLDLLYIVTHFTAVVSSLIYFVTIFHSLPVRTSFQYLELRFNKYLGRLSAILMMLGQMFYMGLVIYLPAAALNAVTPLPLEWSIVLTAGFCTFYTVLGGMKAVIWTDVLQFGMMVVGIAAVFVQGMINVGGFERLISAVERGERNTIGRFDYGLISRISPLARILGGFFLSVNTIGFSQQMVQRYKSCKTARKAQCALLVYLIPFYILYLLNTGNGFIMYAYYEKCDPVQSGKISSIDQGIPYLALELFKNLPGMAGIFVAAVFAGSLSTVSSGINSYSIVIVEDFIAPCSSKVARSERLKIILGRVFVVVLGIILVLIAFAAAFSNSNSIQILTSFAGVSDGPIAGVFLLGLFCPWTSSVGAISGFVTSFGFALFLFIGSEFFKVPYTTNVPPISTENCTIVNGTETTPFKLEYSTTTEALTHNGTDDGHSALQDLFNINYNLFIFIGSSATIVVGIIVSLISGPNKPSEADPMLFIPLIDNPCFPDKVRKFFRFGVPEIQSDQISCHANDQVEHEYEDDKI